MIFAYFNAPIALDSAKFTVKLAGETVEGTLQSDGKSILISGNVSFYNDGDEVIITGIKLPGLFPDYVFTYKSALQK
jgi:hypothetical protein